MTSGARAGLGAAAWLVWAGLRVPGAAATWELAWVLLAAWAAVPLLLDLLGDPGDAGFSASGLAWARRLHPAAAALLGVAIWFPPGLMAAAWALPWAAWTGLLGAVGIARLRRDGVRLTFEGGCADLALVLQGAGGVALVAACGRWAPSRLGATGVAELVFHLQYAGGLLPLAAGLVQKELFFLRLAARAAVGVVLGVLAVSAGVLIRGLGWGVTVESAAGCGLAVAGMLVGILQVRLGLEARLAARWRGLMVAAGVALFLGMAVGGFQAWSPVRLPDNAAWPTLRLVQAGLLFVGLGPVNWLVWRRWSAGART